MPDDSSFNTADAVKPDGFVDFYQLIGMPPGAPEEQLRSRISTLYDEAQANRDHRNIHKRREYQLLLELLPQARTVLLNAGKRLSYDKYSDQAQRQQTTMSFDEFLGQVARNTDEQTGESVGLLGVHETTAKGVQGKTVKMATARAKTPGNSTATGAPKERPSSTYVINAAISLLVFVAAFVIANLAGQWAVPTAAGIAIVAGIVAYAVTYFSFGARTRT